MLLPLFFFSSLVSAEYINDTKPVTINKNGESNFEIDIGADGIEFTLIRINQLSFKGVQNDKSKLINIILNFHDDDYHNTDFYLTTENVHITFACDDPIKFSLKSLTSHNTDFSSGKPISANVTTNQDIELDYVSFVNGFGPGSILSGAKLGEGLYADFNSKLKVELPDTVKEITFSDTSFRIELENGEKDSFSNLFNQNYQIILLSNEGKDEIIIDATSPKIRGNITIIAANAILNATEEFKQVTSSIIPIKICCEIIILPYDTVPTGIFQFITEDMDEKLDQVIMTNGIRSYCLYDSDEKCDVYGTIPLKIEVIQTYPQFTVHSGKSMTYVLCTKLQVQIVITNTAAPSLTINGTSKMNQAVIVSQDLSSITESLSLTNIQLQMNGRSPFRIKNLNIGSNVTFYGTGWNDFKFFVSNSFNSTFDWYLNNIEKSTLVSFEFEEGSKIILYDFNNIAHLFLGEDDCFKVQYDDEDESKVVKFPNENNRIIIYTNDKYFSMDVQGNPFPYGNFELHVLLLEDITDLLTVNFPDDWKNVEEVEGGPIGLHVETLSHNKNTITIPFDEFPKGFVEYDEDKFNLYSTVNTTICLYNKGQSECTPVIGGRSCEIPENGEITIEEGTQYIYSADEKVTIPENLHFVFDKNSAKAVGFSFSNYGKVKMTVSDETLTTLYLNKVNFTCEVTSSSHQLKVNNYVNYYSSFSIDGSFSVDESIVISVSEFRYFEEANFAFTGKLMTVIDPGLITEIEFTETDWTIDLENGQKPFRIDETGMTLKIESSSSNVTFDITEGVKTLTTLDFKSTASDSVVYFTPRWIDSAISIDFPVKIQNDVQCTNVQLYHPFTYINSEWAKSLVDYAPQIKDCPYRNTSVCLSINGDSDCGISSFHLKEKVSTESVYTVPAGHRFEIIVADDNLNVAYNSESAKNISIASSGKEVRPIKLTISESTPDDALMMLNDLEVNLTTEMKSIQWKLASLDLYDTTFTSQFTSSLYVSGNCSVEMDVFYNMAEKEGGIFSDDMFKVDGYLTLRDSNEEYLNEIQFSSFGWTLKTSVCNFTVLQVQFKNLVFGVNRPPQTNPRFIPLTIVSDLPFGQIAGNVDINIEEENLYLQVGNDWTKVKSVTGDKISIRATHGKGTSRLFYVNDIEPLKFFVFEKTVHAVNNATCPICLLPSEGYISSCFNHQLDMLPVISNDMNFLLDESREYIIFGSSDEVHDFTYRTDIDYSVSVIAANKVTVKMNNAPSNVDLYFDSLIDDDGECDLIFEKSMTLKSLRFDDSVRITANVENFKLTLLTDLTIDFKGFRRFFREPGIFSKEDSIEVKNFINIVDDGRYNKIECGESYWNLIGNENAWNTTLNRRGSTQRLKLTTEMTIINVTALLPADHPVTSVLSVSLTLQTASAQMNIEPSIANILSFSDGKSVISSVQALSIKGPFSYLPSDLFTMNGSSQYYAYKPTEESSLCLYEYGKSPCSVSGTTPQAVDSSKQFKIRFATKALIVLTDFDVSLVFGAASATSVEIKSENKNKKATLSFSDVKIEKLDLVLDVKSTDLSIVNSNVNLVFKSISISNGKFESDYDITMTESFSSDLSDIQTFSGKITACKSFSLTVSDSGTFSSSSSKGLSILFKDIEKFSLGNLGSVFPRLDYGFDTSNNCNKIVFATSNDDQKASHLTFLNMPIKWTCDLKFAGSQAVYANWLGGTTDFSVFPTFSYKFEGDGSLTVSKSSSASSDWPVPASSDSSFIDVNALTHNLDLTIDSPVTLKLSTSSVKMNYESFSNLLNRNSALLGSDVFFLVKDSLKEVGIGDGKVSLNGISLPLSSTTKSSSLLSSSSVGHVTFVHQSAANNLSVILIDQGTRKISDVKFLMDGGTQLILNEGFSEISEGKITFEKNSEISGGIIVFVLDNKIPSILDYGNDIDIVIGGDGSHKKISKGIIAAIVIAAIATIAAIVVTVIYFVRMKKVDVTKYDYAPGLLDSKSSDAKMQALAL